MKIKSSELIESLDTIRKVSKSSTRQEEALVMFAFGQVIAENGISYISTPFDHSLTECILPFDTLYTLLSKFSPSSELTIFEKENNILFQFKKNSKKSNTKMSIYLDKPFNYIHPPHIKWQPLPDDFIEALKKCKVSLPTESLNPILTTYGIKDNIIVTSDDFRASLFEMEQGFDRNFVLSGDIGQLVIDHQFTEYILDDTAISFKSANDTFAKASLQVNPYPDLKSDVFNHEYQIEVNRQDITNSIDRSTLFADGLSDIDYAIDFNVTTDSILINAANDYGKNNEIIDCVSPKEIKLSVNPVYLSQILKMLNGEDINIGIANGKDLTFKDGNFKHLLASYAI